MRYDESEPERDQSQFVRQIVGAVHKKAQAPGQKARYRFNGRDRSIQNDHKANSTLVMSHLPRPLFNGVALVAFKHKSSSAAMPVARRCNGAEKAARVALGVSRVFNGPPQARQSTDSTDHEPHD
jgi:hypothetical protein